MNYFASEDCGAGIGRVTSSLLLHFFDEVDLVEPSGMCQCAIGMHFTLIATSSHLPSLLHSGHLLETARRNLVELRPSSIPAGHIVGRFIQCGLEEFRPDKERYDAIWIQWAFMYLTDGMLLHNEVYVRFYI